LVGDRGQLHLCRSEVVFVKYCHHHTGEACKNPYAASDRINLSILASGGPFVHRFKDKHSAMDLEPNVLANSGNYVIYDTDVLHTWEALGSSTIVTIQFLADCLRGYNAL
jgi:hypothetical protein